MYVNFWKRSGVKKAVNSDTQTAVEVLKLKKSLSLPPWNPSVQALEARTLLCQGFSRLQVQKELKVTDETWIDWMAHCWVW